jgi:hypothetical protein
MKTYLMKVQKECGPRANPLNHVALVVVRANTYEYAKMLALEAVPNHNPTVEPTYKLLGEHEAKVVRG